MLIRGGQSLADETEEVSMHPSQNHHGRVARDLDAERDSPDQRYPRGGTAAEDPEYYAESPPVAPTYASVRRSYENSRLAGGKLSAGKRLFRSLTRFVLAILIGVGATLAWQSYGDEARKVVIDQAPALGWLLPVAQIGSHAATATLPDLVEQLKPISLDLAVVRQGLEQVAARQEQLAAKQDQMAQNVATLQEVEQDIRQKIFSPPPQSVHVPPHKPPSDAPLPLSTGQPTR
jgi:hypothetical protein